MTHLPVLASPDCMTYPCVEECCSAGVDVWPEERDRLIAEGLATAAQFTGPETDDEGDSLYRTALGARGCVFLGPERGCTLHFTGHKPSVCGIVPRDPEEVAEMAEMGMMPCHASWKW